MNQPRVSILVPCYNVERFLPTCLNSLTGQTLKDIQIICINDGSTDSTGDILREYAAHDPRIEVIEKENSGYGASMNVGLDRARGEYVGITESDDFASRDMFGTLYRVAKRFDLDIAKSNFSYYTGGKDHYFVNRKGLDYWHVFDPAQKPEIIKTVPAIWAAIYRRDMLEGHGIRFRETPGASFQDTGFVFKAWFACRSACLIGRPLLHYRYDNPDSSVKSVAKIYEVCDELDSADEFLSSQGADRRAAFARTFVQQRFRTYQWNYERIDPRYHGEFAQRMLQDMKAAQDCGEFDLSYFDEDLLEPVQQLLNDPDGFTARYPERF